MKEPHPFSLITNDFRITSSRFQLLFQSISKWFELPQHGLAAVANDSSAPGRPLGPGRGAIATRLRKGLVHRTFRWLSRVSEKILNIVQHLFFMTFADWAYGCVTLFRDIADFQNTGCAPNYIWLGQPDSGGRWRASALAFRSRRRRRRASSPLCGLRGNVFEITV